MDIYSLSRSFWDYAFENPDRIKPNHCALYFFAVEHCNRLGWKEKFGMPTTMVMEAVGIKSYGTYIKAFNDLVDFGMFTLIEKSKNQYSSNIVALSKNNKANNKALDKALLKHTSKQSESTHQSIDSIDIQDTSLQETILPEQNFSFDKKESKEYTDLLNDLCVYFKVSEQRNQRQYMIIGNFVRHIESKGDLAYLRKQFEGYKKEKDGKYIHGIDKYLGSPEDSYQDGQWNIREWSVSDNNKVLPMSKRTNRNPQ